MAYNDFLPSVGGFNPNPMTLNEIQNMKIPGLNDTSNFMQTSQGMFGNSNIPMSSSLVQDAAKAAIAKPEQGMSNSDMMKMASMAMSAFNKPQQQAQQPLQQIINDKNEFRFAETPEQKLAKLLRGM